MATTPTTTPGPSQLWLTMTPGAMNFPVVLSPTLPLLAGNARPPDSWIPTGLLSTISGLLSLSQRRSPMSNLREALQRLEAFLRDYELSYEPINDTSLAVVVPGEKKVTTTASFAFGDSTVTVNAFVIRHPDENDLAVYRWLLERNRRMYGLAYSIDHHGDIYLTGRFPLNSIDDDELDRIFGAISEYSDGAFNS